jgi:hypothetical protein
MQEIKLSLPEAGPSGFQHRGFTLAIRTRWGGSAQPFMSRCQNNPPVMRVGSALERHRQSSIWIWMRLRTLNQSLVAWSFFRQRCGIAHARLTMVSDCPSLLTLRYRARREKEKRGRIEGLSFYAIICIMLNKYLRRTPRQALPNRESAAAMD